MAVYDVDLPNGKTIQVQGPDDATDDELISIARTHPSLSKQSAKQSTKAEAEPSGTGMKAGQLPEMGSADQLLKEAKASTPSLQQAMPEAFKATEKTGPLPTAGGMYDLLSKGDIAGAYGSLPENVRDVTEIGAPLAAAALAAKTGYDLYRSNKEVGQGSQGIKARTIGGNTSPVTAAPSTSTVSAEPALSPKEAKIATEIESKYGFNWKDVKNNFNVSNVPITDPTQADILASAYKNQQVPTTTAAPTTPAAEVIAPVAETKPTTPPPAEAPKAAVPPAQKSKPSAKPVPPPSVENLTKEQKGMKNYLVAQYGGGVEGEAAYGKVKEILGSTPEFEKGQGGGLTAEQNKVIKDWRKANIEGPKVNLTKDMKRAFKGGAGISILAAIPGFAEAAQNKDFGKMTDIATDFFVLPFAQSRELAQEFLCWAFDNGVLRVTAPIIEGLETAKNFCLKLGFTYEGFRRDSLIKDGLIVGVHMLGMTRMDWSIRS